MDGTVHFKGRAWTPQGDGLYAEVDGPDLLVFRAGTGGRRYVATNGPSYELMGSAKTLPGLIARIHQVALLVGLTALGWFLSQWNLIGWQV